MAAVWKLWKNPKTQLWEPTFAILTGEPNGKFAEIHERMTFLEPRDYEEYLGPTERAPVHLLRILPAEKMKVQLIENSPIQYPGKPIRYSMIRIFSIRPSGRCSGGRAIRPRPK
jgi:putative SOS response-associated peptidase YedK